jgi:hypothetical protein
VLNELICDCKLATSLASLFIYDDKLVFKVEILDVLVVILLLAVVRLDYKELIEDLLTELSLSKIFNLDLLLVLSPYKKLIFALFTVLSPDNVFKFDV